MTHNSITINNNKKLSIGPCPPAFVFFRNFDRCFKLAKLWLREVTLAWCRQQEVRRLEPVEGQGSLIQPGAREVSAGLG